MGMAAILVSGLSDFFTCESCFTDSYFFSGTHKYNISESLDSQNTAENCSKTCYFLMILSWDSMNFNQMSPLDTVDYDHFSNFLFRGSTWNLSNTGLVASEKSLEILSIFPIQMYGVHTNA